LPLTLLLRIPDLPRFDAATPAEWTLLDAAGAPLRTGTHPLADVPHADRVIAVAPPSQLLNLETALPAVSPAKRDALLRYAIEDKLTIDPATVHAVVLGRTAGAEHVVVAIDRAWLASALYWLQQAGHAPDSLISAAHGVPVADGEWAVLLDAPHGVARRADGFSYNFDATADGKPPFALVLALKEARERQRSPQRLTVYFSRGTAPGNAVDCTLAATWSAALGLPVARGEGNGEEIVTYLAAAKSSSLLTGEFATRGDGASWMVAMRPALSMAALLLTAQLGLTAIDNFRLNREREALETQMTQLFKSAFPAAQAVVDAPLQMSRNLQQAKREHGMAADDDARRALALLARALQEVSPVPTIASLSIEAGVTTVALELDSAAQHVSLRDALGKITNADLSAVEKNTAGKLTARLSIRGGA
jgi:general secretion pathway protein L